MELVKKTFVFGKLNYRSISIATPKYKDANRTPTSAYQDKWPKRIISGIQPTGSLHVGNYFSAMRQCIALQDKGEDVMMFIADLHALTVPQNTNEIAEKTLEVAAYLIASGLDPERSVLFVQSAVPRHSELCWILTCMATHARLAHLPQFKEKSATMKEVPMGLLLYPVLQAADILLYRGTHVPAGADQLQHLQVASQLVRTFHHRYGQLFPTPRPILPDELCERIKSLRDPTKKMSKSDSDSKSRILLSDSDDTIKLKIRKAVTDFNPEVSYCESSRPGVSNLVALHCLAAGLVPEEAVLQAEGLTTAQYKREVAAALVEHLRPVRERALQLLRRPALLRDVLRSGATRARARADVLHHDLMLRLRLSPDADLKVDTDILTNTTAVRQ
ncbi:tryptophan--tRNA ligase, mitochondrial isoform X2 [Aricia agestis]|uniref:tryptophan--tRNA ligase, mitochondrial isoform X2 n=1 Tax=Aricia agestis TaxID=91739 RepID=UPI001C20B6C9|nr:tryptophan--tRNA ligase, mitochondrial isoform X2 [Aricia agestis]XP_041986266.1 tryptophan--tRNA ligase, mitochondrial isoform X2 [Aricia agestis]